MKNLLIIFFIILAQVGVNKKIYSQELGREKIITKEINKRIDGKKDGYWKKYYWNGKIKWEGFYKNGIRVGYWKLYSRDGYYYNQGEMGQGSPIGWWYLTTTKDHIKIDGTRYNFEGKSIGHRTMRW